jgi:hypothetical protein
MMDRREKVYAVILFGFCIFAFSIEEQMTSIADLKKEDSDVK